MYGRNGFYRISYYEPIYTQPDEISFLCVCILHSIRHNKAFI